MLLCEGTLWTPGCKLQSFIVYSSNMFQTEVENSVAVDKIQSKKVNSLEIKEKRKIAGGNSHQLQPKDIGKDSEDS